VFLKLRATTVPNSAQLHKTFTFSKTCGSPASRRVDGWWVNLSGGEQQSEAIWFRSQYLTLERTSCRFLLT